MWTSDDDSDTQMFASATATENDTFETFPWTTGRALVSFKPGFEGPGFDEFIQYVRSKLPGDIEVPSPNRALIDDEPYYWARYNLGVVPASTDALSPFLPEMRRRFGVTDVSDERYIRGRVTASAGSMVQSAWALSATRVTQSNFTGEGINIAILDSGIATRHPAFFRRILDKETFVTGYPVEDGFGHGTHIAGIASGALPAAHGDPRFGIAYAANILVARVMADDGLGTETSMIKGIEWAQDKHADIGVMAFGGAVAVNQKHNRQLEKVMRTALDGNLLLIAETGNDSSRTTISPVNSPANCPSVMAVGSIGPRPLGRATYVPSDFSCGAKNIDGEVNVVAPGEMILSAWPPDTVRILEGTSQAAAAAGGVAALVARSTGLRGRALWVAIERAADCFSSDVVLVGKGLVQAP